MALRISSLEDVKKYRKLTPEKGASIYFELRKNVIEAGILDRSYFFYGLIFLTDLTGFFLCIFGFYILKNPFLLILDAAVLGIFTVRIGGLIHDTGHRAIFKSSIINDVFGYIFSFLIAFPYLVWKVKHNAHHAHTNEEGSDPDLEVPLSFTPEMAKRNRLSVRIFKKYQAWLYLPLGSMVSFTMRFKALVYYFNNLNLKTGILMVVQILGMAVWYSGPFIIFPFWKGLIFFIFINEVAGYYMLNIFAPNHKGMPQFDNQVKFSFLEHQIMSSRDIRSHWLSDYFYMGLNFQIEHHLFPSCPRYKLIKIRPFVLAICLQYQIPYTEMGIIQSNKFIISELKNISMSLEG